MHLGEVGSFSGCKDKSLMSAVIWKDVSAHPSNMLLELREEKQL